MKLVIMQRYFLLSIAYFHLINAVDIMLEANVITEELGKLYN